MTRVHAFNQSSRQRPSKQDFYIQNGIVTALRLLGTEDGVKTGFAGFRQERALSAQRGSAWVVDTADIAASVGKSHQTLRWLAEGLFAMGRHVQPASHILDLAASHGEKPEQTSPWSAVRVAWNENKISVLYRGHKCSGRIYTFNDRPLDDDNAGHPDKQFHDRHTQILTGPRNQVRDVLLMNTDFEERARRADIGGEELITRVRRNDMRGLVRKFQKADPVPGASPAFLHLRLGG